MRQVTVVLIPSSGHGGPWTAVLPPYGSDRLTAPSRSFALKRAQAALPEHLATLAAAGLDDPPAGGPAALARVQVNEPLHRTYTVVLEADEESGAFTVDCAATSRLHYGRGGSSGSLGNGSRKAIGLVLEHMAAENEPLPAEVRPPELATLTVARTRAMASAMA